ncbi:hypothetical protein [Maribacter aquivivus]|uniref:hypothetical protein n=1 Tax=Maribacter aquivivus TaxID=228958 RepID=UPI002492599C|nr:hypothetical protein [Maribacter aquivivus]
MATDGPKIIDGDTGHDTYWGIMDMYDNGISLEKIKIKFPFDIDYFDEFDFEIYITSLALAFWEIGLINDLLLKKVNETISKGIGVKVWTEECDKNIGKKRQQALNRLLKKISKSNEKIRKPKKYRKVTNFHFQPNDLLSFKLSDGYYRAVYCALITQQRGVCTYDLVGTTYKSSEKPNESNILDFEIAGRWIGSGYDRHTMIEMQPEIESLWKLNKTNDKKFWGLSYHLVTHKDFYNLKENFEKVGTLNIKESYKKTGGYGYESSFDRFEDIFGDFHKHMQIFGEKCISIKELIDKTE